MKRVLKRLDLTARSLFAVVEPGSCFAGTPARARARRRPLLHARRRRRGPTLAFSAAERRRAADAQRPVAPRDALPRPTRAAREPLAPASRFDAEAALEAGLVTFAPDEIDWDDEVRLAIEERASLSPDALTGMEANLRFAGPETMETKIFGRLSAWQNWIFQRPNAVGEHGALTLYGKPERPEVRLDAGPETMSTSISTDAKIPNNVDLVERQAPAARARGSGSRTSSTGGRRWARRASRSDDVYLRTAISVDADGWAHFDYVKMPDYRWGIFLGRPDAGPHDRLRRPHGRAGVAGGARRAPQRAAPPHRDPGRHRARERRAAAPARPDRARRSTTCATCSR